MPRGPAPHLLKESNLKGPKPAPKTCPKHAKEIDFSYSKLPLVLCGFSQGSRRVSPRETSLEGGDEVGRGERTGLMSPGKPAGRKQTGCAQKHLPSAPRSALKARCHCSTRLPACFTTGEMVKKGARRGVWSQNKASTEHLGTVPRSCRAGETKTARILPRQHLHGMET